ncbi:putative prolyl-tRNA synthetase associated domain-containing protein 1, partial [Tetrabaena socialis]
MPLTKDELLARLGQAGISYDMFEHPPVMTVEAQINALPGNPKTVLKNLFIKDKKHRCYIITALPETKIDLQVLSARLGVGKGGTRLAPEELLTALLQVPLGSVTPLAVANPEAADVLLLLDSRIRDPAFVPEGSAVYVHPLVNTASLAMSPAALEAAI